MFLSDGCHPEQLDFDGTGDGNHFPGTLVSIPCHYTLAWLGASSVT